MVSSSKDRLPVEDRYARLARTKRQPTRAGRGTAAERLELVEAMLVDCWRLAEAAMQSMSGAPKLPPWERGRRKDAEAHRLLQTKLRALLGDK